MDGWLEAIRVALSGIINWSTLIGLTGGVVVYALFSTIASRLDDKEYMIRLLARLQMWLECRKNRWAKLIGKWLWARIIALDYDWRYQIIVDRINEDTNSFSDISRLSQVEYGQSVDRTIYVIEAALNDPRATKRLIRLYEAALRELRQSHQTGRRRIRTSSAGP